MKKLAISLMVLMVFSSAYVFSEGITREQAKKMMEDCQILRQQKIAPLKQIEIEICINKGKKKEYCERINEQFGEVPFPGRFWELEECQAAYKVEDYFKKNPRKMEYDQK